MVERRIPGHITGLYVFAVINLCALLNISLVSGDVFVFDRDQNHTIATMEDQQASFGPDFPDDGLWGRLIYVKPYNACEPVRSPPITPTDLPWIALIARGSCNFDKKVLNVQNSGFSAAIVHNHEGNDQTMQMGSDGDSDKVRIPSVFVGYTDGMNLARRYAYNKSDMSIEIKIEEFGELGFNFLYPFIAVLVTGASAVIGYCVYKCVRCYKKKAYMRNVKKALNKLPIRKYKKGDQFDVCAVCLEDYEEGEKLRVLPCNHTYHTKCIDKWLLTRSQTCPQCKRRAMDLRGFVEVSSDDDEADEHTPLLTGNNDQENPAPGAAGEARQGRSPSERSRRRRERGYGASETEAAGSERSGTSPSEPHVVVIRPGHEHDSSSSEEENDEGVTSDPDLLGAVGGVGISDQQAQKDETPGDTVVETVDETARNTELEADTTTSDTSALLTVHRKRSSGDSKKSSGDGKKSSGDGKKSSGDGKKSGKKSSGDGSRKSRPKKSTTTDDVDENSGKEKSSPTDVEEASGTKKSPPTNAENSLPRAEGSINAAFTSSTSSNASEEDGALQGGKKSKKKKKKPSNNVV